jgi:hypothetical protein
MGLLVRNLAKPVFTVAVAIVMLAAGAGTAMAATTGAPPKHKKVTEKEIAADEAVMSKCARSRFDLTKEQVKTVGLEGAALALGVPIDAGTFGFATPVLIVGEGVFTVVDGLALGYEQISAIQACYPELFKGNAESGSNIPHPALPAWLKNLKKKDRNKLNTSNNDQ